MATVTSFAEFLTAIGGSEDIVLANDIDAQAEGYDNVGQIMITRPIDGQGYKISNVTIITADRSALYINASNSSIFKNIIFDNLLYKANSSGSLIETSLEGYIFQNCKFGVQMNLNNFKGAVIYYNSSVKRNVYFVESALDVTMKNHGGSGYPGTTQLWYDYTHFTRCNIAIREAYITSTNANSESNPAVIKGLVSSAVVLDRCNTDRVALEVNGTGSYVALKDCTATAQSVKVTGSSSMYFCNDSDITCNASGVTVLTPEQLRSESYLRSIGFLP